MPQIPSYERQASLNIAPSFRVQSTAPNGAESIANALGVTVQVMQKQAAEEKQKEDTAAVLAASNQMTSEMLEYFNGENGVFSTKGINAKGTFQQSKDYMDNTLKKYVSMLGNDDQRLAFMSHMKENSYNYLRSAATHERNEMEGYRKQEYDTGLTINNQGIASNWNDINAISGLVKRNDQLLDSSALDFGVDKDTINLKKQAQNSLGIKSAVQAAIDNDNFNQAKEILKTFKGNIEPTVYNDLYAKVNKYVEKNNDFILVDKIIQGSMRQDGTVDVELADKLLRNEMGPGKAIDYNVFKTNLIGKESGGSYDTVNKDTGAIGKYQILPENWAQWAQDAGLSADAEPTPENQEIVADAKLKPLYEKYGPQGAAVAWYAGEQNAQRWIDGEKDAIDDNGNHYAWDKKQGEYDSITEYVSSVAGNNFDAGRFSAVKEKINARIVDVNKMKSDKDKQYKYTVGQQINSAKTLEAGLDIINSSNLPQSTKNSLATALKARFNASFSGTDMQKFFAKYEITGYAKDTNLMEELNDKLSNGDEITPAQQTRYNNAIDRINAYNKFIEGGGYEPIGNVKEQIASKKEQNEAEQEMWGFISEAAKKGFSREEIEQGIKEEAADRGWNNADYFIENTDWEKIGNKRGGVQ